MSALPRLADGVRLDELQKGILWPVVYASIFKAPLRRAKLWRQVVGVEATEDEVARSLESPQLRSVLEVDDGLIRLRGQDVALDFRRREKSTQALLGRHADILSFVAGLRHVRLAALSGGCAHDAADDGDIDVFLVTDPGTLWRTLLWSTLVAKRRGWRRVLCLNYLVDSTALELPWRDFYGAFELISLKVLKGDDTFSEVVGKNPWVDLIFPNFFRSRLHGQNSNNKKLDSSRTPILELLARMIQRSYLRYRLPATSGVELSDHVVRLHTSDHRERLRGLFQDALQNIGMEAPSWI